MRFLFFLLVLNSINLADAQGIYTIEKLPVTINSGCEELKPISSESGDTLFFIRSYCHENTGGELAGEDIWMSVFSEGTGWSKATNRFGYTNHSGPDILIGMDQENASLLYIDYASSGQNNLINIRRLRLWSNHSDPNHKKSISGISVGDDYHDLFLDPGNEVLFISMHSLNSIGLEDIYISFHSGDGKWTKPENLGPVINTRGFEISPFLSPDGRTLYFCSSGHQGMGDGDLYFSNRLDSGWTAWSEPVNMGSPFNSPHFDAYLSVSFSGEYFFSSNRDSSLSDIYHVVRQEFNHELTATVENDRRELTKPSQDPIDTPVINLPVFSLYFDLDEYKLSSEELLRLGKYIREILEYDYLVWRIAGYTDDSGSETYNLKLSERRAKFVYNQLKRSGIAPEKLFKEGKGVFMPSGKKEIPASSKRKVEITGIPGSTRTR